MSFSMTWLGHATFIVRTPGGKRIMFDPWVQTNPSCPDAAKKVGALDLILVTHGHSDHIGDAVSIARSTDANLVAPYELSVWFGQKGLKRVIGMNPGGTIRTHGLSITMVPAVHSSSIDAEPGMPYMGLAVGYVVALEDGLTLYFAGDTAVFGDMKLIGEMYRPVIGFLPIGDCYTMGPEQAAVACGLLGIRQVVPMHWGTFPELTGTPGRLRELVAAKGIEVLDLKPGETTE
jgi:L-ascorbate metabolism protein UlaG (beta-lactamase superfamily)